MFTVEPGGKKQYDRNFLLKLQYEPMSMIRPVNLPALSDIILSEIIHGQTNDKVLRPHSRELGRSSVASPLDFLPWFVKFVPNGDCCTQGDYHQRRRPTQQTWRKHGNWSRRTKETQGVPETAV